MKKLFVVFALALSGCATTSGKTFGQTYSDNTEKVRTCMESTIVAVLAVPVRGFGQFTEICK